ncbi:MAG: isoleucine--tRNA ligase [Bacteroidales bacterium]|nr:isoleucine--tRNA ligase [Bacteroidales bacterium]
MAKKFPEYKGLDLSAVNKDILKWWDDHDTFNQSLRDVNDKGEFVFYEGPPSANGIPGIHHVMARTIKDAICRYKTQRGYLVKRKAGWDTHGLPVELGVEKAMGITKEDIGTKITVAEYNAACRTDVMKYTDMWEDLTRKMGYWVDMHDPYITYDNRYIETLWWLLKELYNKGLLYKGYTIQPFSPAAGTGLSSHELNLPGCYRDVKDTTCVALFNVIRNQKSEFLFEGTDTAEVNIMAWTTTPWTLPSNTGLAVGKDITYVLVRTFNPYTGTPITVVLAKALLHHYFPETSADLKIEAYVHGDKKFPYRVLAEFQGKKLKGIEYKQLLDWVNPGEGAFRIVTGDFVTTEDGTGIVHIAPTFGADDYKVGKENGIPPLMVKRSDGTYGPLVDKRGCMVPIADMDEDFVRTMVNTDSYSDFEARPVKNDYDAKLTDKDASLDVDISVWLKQEGRAFRIEKMVHNYPHCWRTDKPILYYPLDSWFIKTTAMRDRMIELNNTINWKPASTGTGRFGKWLENLVDWNLSRSRYWGTPLPIWVTEDRSEMKVIGSAEELKKEIEKAVAAGMMKSNPLASFVPGDNSSANYETFDLHRPFVDDIILVSDSGVPMKREEDLIDVWFDSGAMPYAQHHYPFENKENFHHLFPADYIAEGVDQTRGWFFTLHAIAVMISDSVSFKNIISNGLVLDKNGNKMSKRLNNAVDPFGTIEKYGSDPLRWYMITNAQPWDNLKFDISGVEESKRKFFGTLYNTYSFFALYANIDGFTGGEPGVPVKERPEIDRWILSLLNTLIQVVGECYDDYDLTRAGRSVQEFVTESLSNWYVRLNRKRFWGGEMDRDKLAAYQTLYTCLRTVSQLAAPIAPFYMERLYTDLMKGAQGAEQMAGGAGSVHLALFPEYDAGVIDKALEERMDIAQGVSSMILALRKKVNIKVRQPLARIMVPVTEPGFREQFEAVRNLILTEVNVKEVEYIDDADGILVKKIKPDFRALGPRFGKLMKEVAAAVTSMSQADIMKFEQAGTFEISIGGEMVTLERGDVEIISEDIPGWLVANEGKLTVALDITVTDELRAEGIAREFVNRLQNLRKESGFEVTDKITVLIEDHDMIRDAVQKHAGYIGAQTLANEVKIVASVNGSDSKEIEIDDLPVRVVIKKAS